MSSTYRPPLQAVRPTGYGRVDHRCGNVVIRFERKTFVVIRGREYRHLRPIRWKFTLCTRPIELVAHEKARWVRRWKLI